MGENQNQLLHGSVSPPPIQETTSESRSPVPAHDCGDRGESLNTAPKSKPAGDESAPVSNSPGISNRSFVDHLVELLDEYREQTIGTERNLRFERERGRKLEDKVSFYKREFSNYRLSWIMDQAEIRHLEARIMELEKQHRISCEKEDATQQLGEYIDQESRVKTGSSDSATSVNITHVTDRDTTSTQTNTLNMIPTRERENLPTDDEMRVPFVQQPRNRRRARSGNRRPYIRKSPDEDRLKLPRIIKTKAKPECRNERRHQSPTIFPALVPNQALVCSASSSSSTVTSRTKSKLPVALRNFRATASIGSIPTRRDKPSLPDEQSE